MVLHFVALVLAHVLLTTPSDIGDIFGGLDWTAVLTSILSIASNTFVVAAIVAVFALRFFPRMLKALFGATRSR